MLRDDLNKLTEPVPPKKYRQHAEFDNDGGTAATGPVRHMVTDYDELLTLAGLDPTAFRIVGKVQQWTKTHHDREDTYSFFFSFERIAADEDDNEIARELASKIVAVPPAHVEAPTGLPMVVAVSDTQIGKEGATPEGMDSMFHRALARAAAEAKENRPRMLIIADCGDPIEGITSSAPNQIATNTLSLDDQLRLWTRRLTQTILTLAPYAGEVHVVSVPSNHGEIRNTAGKIGNGDYGLGVARTVEEAFSLHGNAIQPTFHYPDAPHEVITYVPVDDHLIAFYHGHHAKQTERIPQWVANQAASRRSRMRDATIAVNGHFHTPSYRYSRGRELIGLPCFDPGSPWFENLTGEYSNPALTTFNVRDGRVIDLRFIEP